MKNNAAIVVLIGIIFVLFTFLVYAYEDKIDSLNQGIREAKEEVATLKLACTNVE